MPIAVIICRVAGHSQPNLIQLTSGAKSATAQDSEVILLLKAFSTASAISPKVSNLQVKFTFSLKLFSFSSCPCLSIQTLVIPMAWPSKQVSDFDPPIHPDRIQTLHEHRRTVSTRKPITHTFAGTQSCVRLCAVCNTSSFLTPNSFSAPFNK